MSYSANACLFAARHQNAVLVILKQVLPFDINGQSAGRHALALLIKIKEIGASRKCQPCVATFANGITIGCKLRLDLTLS
jgi:hypothetical protein